MTTAARRLVLAALASTAAVAVAGSAAGSQLRPAMELHGGNFWSNCRFSHTAADDPIVLPRRPGWSHAHTFFGNVSTNAYSTLASLGRATTTCRPHADGSAYWVPTLFRNGRPVRPAKAQLYYVVHGYRRMRAFPPGLRMIAGNSHAAVPQGSLVTYWDCAGRAGIRTRPTAAPPARCGTVTGTLLMRRAGSKTFTRVTMRSRTQLELRVNFPDCWDGRHPDSPDHRMHMAYSRGFVCPRSHPVKVPLIQLMIRYPIRSGTGVTLASGGRFSAHADFFNAWDQRALVRLVDDCFHNRPCDPARVGRMR